MWIAGPVVVGGGRVGRIAVRSWTVLGEISARRRLAIDPAAEDAVAGLPEPAVDAVLPEGGQSSRRSRAHSSAYRPDAGVMNQPVAVF